MKMGIRRPPKNTTKVDFRRETFLRARLSYFARQKIMKSEGALPRIEASAAGYKMKIHPPPQKNGYPPATNTMQNSESFELSVGI